MIGDTTIDKKVSAYNPSQSVKDFTSDIKSYYQDGYDILNQPFMELNDLSVIERDNRDRRTFNAFVDENIEDPAEAWKWRGTRSKARNKALAMHAQLTAGYIVPMFMAQNEADEEDREFSEVMRDICEWMVYNSSYKSSYLMTAMSMLVSPVVYLGAEYRHIHQKIKVKTEQGYRIDEIIDEVLSGFDAPVYSCDQILITNAFEQNIQRQKCIFKERWIEYGEAEAIYGTHEDFIHVQPGVDTVFNAEDALFYDVKDDDHEGLVREVTYLNRSDDTEVCYMGGIYLGDNSVENNPIRHRDNRNAPKYNVVPFGYQRITEHFFYYKSLMNSQYWDNMLLDAQYEIGMNRAFLDTNMPIGISGTDKVDSEVIFPGSVQAWSEKDVRITPILPQANLGNMFQAMDIVERSMEESSVSDTAAGQLPDPNQKATTVVIAERNARTMLQGVGKTLAESVVQYGQLMSDIAVNHLSTAQVDQIVGENTRMKYRSFILKNKMVNGKGVTKSIRFDEGLLGMEMNDKDKKAREISMLMDVNYPDNEEEIYLVNPEIFSRRKYLVRVEPEKMFPKNEEFTQAMMTQLLPLLQNNPFVSLEALTRKTMYAFFNSEAEDLMQKQQPMIPSPISQGGEMPQTTMGQGAMNKALAPSMSGVGTV